ncbi:ubiquinol-cytochrome c reductase core subunit 1 [Malassezia vespertilionis]|uniref:ubiquinol-cytochrome c reductase core subunit 1 n=1 Tax=Malassezia vespertilionis TaxID=2020962 RepID=UPI0024B12EEE|nr:ubiquinol-cytochrome c reductase core subunit 1 [Malassezia vespertilionis]WFD06931.1 ubiquinol-cytochrome c reductase core subunit 1 [Malassezia vespertilionis]
MPNEAAPVVALTVAARAGPRYENSEGVSHALKNFAFRSTNKHSALHIVRESELNGGSLSAGLSKEHVFLTVEFLKGAEDHFAALLAEVTNDAKYCKYEYAEDVVPSMAEDLAAASHNPIIAGLDALHATAFRNRGVGNSLFASPASPVALGDLRAFGKKAYARSNIAVVGSGLNTQELEHVVSKHFGNVATGEKLTDAPSKYYGGVHRAPISDMHGHALRDGHFFLAFEGAGRGKAPALAVLETLLGGGPPAVKWSHGSSPLSGINKQVEGAHACAFNTSFADSGLFGLHVCGPNSKVGDAAALATKALKQVASSNPSAQELSRAIAIAKFNTAAQVEGPRIASHELVGASLLDDSAVELDAQFALLESVKPADVCAAAEKLLKSQPTSVALGSVRELPFADSLL